MPAGGGFMLTVCMHDHLTYLFPPICHLLAGGGEAQSLCQDDQRVTERVLAREAIRGRYTVVLGLGQTAKPFPIPVPPDNCIRPKRRCAKFNDERICSGSAIGVRGAALRWAGPAASERGWRRQGAQLRPRRVSMPGWLDVRRPPCRPVGRVLPSASARSSNLHQSHVLVSPPPPTLYHG